MFCEIKASTSDDEIARFECKWCGLCDETVLCTFTRDMLTVSMTR